ncbi:hypothetical protein DPEC_G00095310 [Dallia pectoralis]|uniref:Uncharacterized protein n=1 Tax=Dallia pectoralis TaxID=75939 RepID=A0ACC2GVK5_DALPE|nr:hypothetical protein DPEC_G00095310 [Dallia pectoralis]
MKGPTKHPQNTPQILDFDQSRSCFLKSISCLRLNTMDFSDLWDEEDWIGEDSSEEDGGTASPMGRASGRHTLKLHWRELQSLPPLPRVSRFGPQTIWAGLEPVHLDINRLEYLFETKGNESIYSARMGQRRLQSLVPSVEELALIRAAQAKDPNSPLAAAELCLLTLGEISHLGPRLQLWAFVLDYDSLEKEIAEPLFHLKLAMEQLAGSQTFRCILATVLAIGNFLNGCKARGFELSYLGKLSQVRDTHSRQPLLHHVCVLMLQLYPQSTDLYSDITSVTRTSKSNYAQVQSSLSQLEVLCKTSWDQLSLLDRTNEKKTGGQVKRLDRESTLRQQLPQFLKDCDDRLKVLRAVNRRVINRFHSFLLFLGYSHAMVRDTNAEDFCKTVSDFSLEYRTTRLAILEKRETEREKRENVSSRTPRNKHNHQHPNTPRQESFEQQKLEEVLQKPESAFQFDSTLARHRRKQTDIKGPLSQRLRW